MAIRIETRIPKTDELRKKVAAGVSKEVKAKSNELGKVMADEANKLIQTRFKTRPFARRRDPGSRRAAGAVSYAVLGNDFPFDVVYRILGGKDVEKRVMILHYGRISVDIRPSGNWPLTFGKGIMLSWPSDTATPSKVVGAPFIAFAKSDRKFVFGTKKRSDRVTTGAGFLEEAQTIARRKVFGK